MKKMKRFRTVTLALIVLHVAFLATGQQGNQLNYDPDKAKVIPDKVIEFGIPLLIILLVLNTLVTIMKNRADHQLKLRMIEKGVSEETLVRVFSETKMFTRLQPIKWFLFCFATSVSFAVIHLFREWLKGQPGFMAVAILLFFNAIAFLVYYRILNKKI